MQRVVWSWEMGMANGCRWKSMVLLGVPVSSFQGDNIPSRKLQSGGSRGTWTHISLFLCFLSALDGQIRSHHTVISWLQQENSFQCCISYLVMRKCSVVFRRKSVPDEKIAELGLEREKSYLLASNSQAWAFKHFLLIKTPVKSRKPRWRMKFLFGFDDSLCMHWGSAQEDPAEEKQWHAQFQDCLSLKV